MKPRFSRITKAIAWLLTAVCAVSDSAWAASQSLTTESSSKPAWVRSLDALPAEAASVEKIHVASDTVIFLIRDAHTNPSAQRNLSITLDYLTGSQQVRQVFAEAGEGDNSLIPLQTIAPADELRATAEAWMRRGEMKGSEYSSLLSDRPFELEGAEDLALYRASVEAYLRLAKGRSKMEAYLSRFDAAVAAIKPKIFSEALLRFDRRRQECRDEIGRTAECLAELERTSRALGIPNEPSSRLAAIERLRREDAKFDSTKLPLEWKELVSGVWVEAESRERAVYERLAIGPQERKLAEIDRRIRQIRRAALLEADPADGRNLDADRSALDLVRAAAAVNRMIFDRGMDPALSIVLDRRQHRLLQDAARFYRLTRERDRHFVRRLAEAQTVRPDARRMALITGGYHTEHLTRLIADKGWSYAVIAPQVREATDRARYERLLLDVPIMKRGAAAPAFLDTPFMRRTGMDTPVLQTPAASFAREVSRLPDSDIAARLQTGARLAEKILQIAGTRGNMSILLQVDPDRSEDNPPYRLASVTVKVAGVQRAAIQVGLPTRGDDASTEPMRDLEAIVTKTMAGFKNPLMETDRALAGLRAALRARFKPALQMRHFLDQLKDAMDKCAASMEADEVNQAKEAAAAHLIPALRRVHHFSIVPQYGEDPEILDAAAEMADEAEALQTRIEQAESKPVFDRSLSRPALVQALKKAGLENPKIRDITRLESLAQTRSGPSREAVIRTVAGFQGYSPAGQTMEETAVLFANGFILRSESPEDLSKTVDRAEQKIISDLERTYAKLPKGEADLALLADTLHTRLQVPVYRLIDIALMSDEKYQRDFVQRIPITLAKDAQRRDQILAIGERIRKAVPNELAEGLDRYRRLAVRRAMDQLGAKIAQAHKDSGTDFDWQKKSSSDLNHLRIYMIPKLGLNAGDIVAMDEAEIAQFEEDMRGRAIGLGDRSDIQATLKRLRGNSKLKAFVAEYRGLRSRYAQLGGNLQPWNADGARMAGHQKGARALQALSASAREKLLKDFLKSLNGRTIVVLDVSMKTVPITPPVASASAPVSKSVATPAPTAPAVDDPILRLLAGMPRGGSASDVLRAAEAKRVSLDLEAIESGLASLEAAGWVVSEFWPMGEGEEKAYELKPAGPEAVESSAENPQPREESPTAPTEEGQSQAPAPSVRYIPTDRQKRAAKGLRTLAKDRNIQWTDVTLRAAKTISLYDAGRKWDPTVTPVGLVLGLNGTQVNGSVRSSAFAVQRSPNQISEDVLIVQASSEDLDDPSEAILQMLAFRKAESKMAEAAAKPAGKAKTMTSSREEERKKALAETEAKIKTLLYSRPREYFTPANLVRHVYPSKNKPTPAQILHVAHAARILVKRDKNIRPRKDVVAQKTANSKWAKQRLVDAYAFDPLSGARMATDKKILLESARETFGRWTATHEHREALAVGLRDPFIALKAAVAEAQRPEQILDALLEFWPHLRAAQMRTFGRRPDPSVTLESFEDIPLQLAKALSYAPGFGHGELLLTHPNVSRDRDKELALIALWRSAGSETSEENRKQIRDYAAQIRRSWTYSEHSYGGSMVEFDEEAAYRAGLSDQALARGVRRMRQEAEEKFRLQGIVLREPFGTVYRYAMDRYAGRVAADPARMATADEPTPQREGVTLKRINQMVPGTYLWHPQWGVGVFQKGNIKRQDDQVSVAFLAPNGVPAIRKFGSVSFGDVPTLWVATKEDVRLYQSAKQAAADRSQNRERMRDERSALAHEAKGRYQLLAKNYAIQTDRMTAQDKILLKKLFDGRLTKPEFKTVGWILDRLESTRERRAAGERSLELMSDAEEWWLHRIAPYFRVSQGPTSAIPAQLARHQEETVKAIRKLMGRNKRLQPEKMRKILAQAKSEPAAADRRLARWRERIQSEELLDQILMETIPGVEAVLAELFPAAGLIPGDPGAASGASEGARLSAADLRKWVSGVLSAQPAAWAAENPRLLPIESEGARIAQVRKTESGAVVRWRGRFESISMSGSSASIGSTFAGRSDLDASAIEPAKARSKSILRSHKDAARELPARLDVPLDVFLNADEMAQGYTDAEEFAFQLEWAYRSLEQLARSAQARGLDGVRFVIQENPEAWPPALRLAREAAEARGGLLHPRVRIVNDYRAAKGAWTAELKTRTDGVERDRRLYIGVQKNPGIEAAWFEAAAFLIRAAADAAPELVSARAESRAPLLGRMTLTRATRDAIRSRSRGRLTERAIQIGILGRSIRMLDRLFIRPLGLRSEEDLRVRRLAIRLYSQSA